MTKGVPGRVQSVVNVHNPSVEVHPADPLHNTGAAIIIAAGGAHQALNIGTEGADVASFLYNHGVATVLLRNRLRRDGYEPPTDGVADALQAVRVVRGVAATYGIDPQRIGLMGFSAGAELAAGAALEFPAFAAGGAPSARPDFVVLVYPGPSPFARGATPTIPPNVPPSFVVTAGTDDQVHALWADEWVHAMLAAGVPNVEFHVYGRGGHGGGLKDRGGLPFGTWQDRFIDWFRDLGFLQTPAAAQRAAPNTPPRGASTPAAAPVQRDAPRP